MTDSGPITGGDGGDAADLGEEIAPGVLASIENGGIALEHTVREIGLA